MTIFAWTPLIAASDFTGLQTDLLTASTGIITAVLVVVGVGILIRMLTR